MVLAYVGISLPNYLKNPLREKLSFCSAQELAEVKISHDEYCAFLSELQKLEFVQEITLISTCNRFEVIVYIDDRYDIEKAGQELCSSIQKQRSTKLNFNFLYADEAKWQLLRTYCGLNSGLVGENEICVQMGTAIRQASAMSYMSNEGLALLADAVKLQKLIKEEIYKQEISYCDIALRRSCEKFALLESDLAELERVVVFGSGNTARSSCLSLIAMGVKPEAITVLHRVSPNSVQIEHIKLDPLLRDLNFVRTKDSYATAKASRITLAADFVIFGIDTKAPVLELPRNYNAKIIDFNSNASCTFAPGFDFRNYVSNIEADSFVRHYSSSQGDDVELQSRIDKAESLISDFVVSGQFPAFAFAA